MEEREKSIAWLIRLLSLPNPPPPAPTADVNPRALSSCVWCSLLNHTPSPSHTHTHPHPTLPLGMMRSRRLPPPPPPPGLFPLLPAASANSDNTHSEQQQLHKMNRDERSINYRPPHNAQSADSWSVGATSRAMPHSRRGPV